METREFIVKTPDEFSSVIEQVFAVTTQTPGSQLVTLTGDLGAGKTTFTQELAKYLGVTEPVVSPTFGIMKIYPLLDHSDYDQLVHIDAYRIEDISEAGPLRLEEVFQQTRTLICLEWPENIAAILPTERVEISIEITEGEQRKVAVSKTGD